MSTPNCGTTAPRHRDAVLSSLVTDPERNPDTLPYSGDPSGPCPNCGRVSNFGTGQTFHIAEGNFAIELVCQGCGRGCVVIEEQVPLSDDAHVRRPIHWWPVPGIGRMDPAVPQRIAAAYDEGMRCLAVRAPRAAAVMFRAMLALVVADKGSDKAKANPGLKGRLRQMAADGTLHPSLAAWASAIREHGDGGAHPDELPAPDHVDAENLALLCRRMIEFMYEIDARIDRDRRSAAPAGAAEESSQTE